MARRGKQRIFFTCELHGKGAYLLHYIWHLIRKINIDFLAKSSKFTYENEIRES
jgi:hypothetical protein